ncbi:MAG: glycosyltransferase [Deltaproteobacteria bacterium]|nr:glycosyltransferase [Deltaproteobacteria bacterium]
MTKKRLRIVYLIGSGYAASYWTVDPLVKLRELGHDVIAVCPETGTLAQRFQEKGIETYAVSFPGRLINLIKCLYTINELRKLFIALKPDIVHYQITHAIFLGRVAAWLARVPVRITQWPGPAPLKRKSYHLADLLTAWIDGAIIATSTEMAGIYAKYPLASIRKKARLIYYGYSSERFRPGVNGLSLRKKYGASDKDFVVAMVAYFYPPTKDLYNGFGLKGHEILFKAASETVKQDTHIKFWIVGDNVTENAKWYKDYLKEYAHKLNLDDNVVFTGLIQDTPSVYAACDALVMPSFTEGIGGSAIEALLMERPVVASTVGEMAHAVRDNESGFLVPPGEPHALAEAILKLSRLSPERRREMGRAGRRIAMEIFDMDKVARQTGELYMELLSQHEAG